MAAIYLRIFYVSSWKLLYILMWVVLKIIVLWVTLFTRKYWLHQLRYRVWLEDKEGSLRIAHIHKLSVCPPMIEVPFIHNRIYKYTAASDRDFILPGIESILDISRFGSEWVYTKISIMWIGDSLLSRNMIWLIIYIWLLSVEFNLFTFLSYE